MRIGGLSHEKTLVVGHRYPSHQSRMRLDVENASSGGGDYLRNYHHYCLPERHPYLMVHARVAAVLTAVDYNSQTRLVVAHATSAAGDGSVESAAGGSWVAKK